MQVCEAAAVCAAVVMGVPEKVVKLLLEWQASHAIPATGTWVAVDGAVGEPPAASGINLG